jgi:hypothetical protein
MTEATTTSTSSRRGMLAGTTVAFPGGYQPLPACPFCPPLGNIPLIRLPGRRSATKYAPSAAMLTGEAGTNPVLSRLQGWGIPAQTSMPGIAYDLRGATLNYGANHG